MRNMKNKYSVEGIQLIDEHLIVLMKDLETDELFEITEETLKNKVSRTDLVIYKVVMKHLYNYLLSDEIEVDEKQYIKNVTK